MANHDLPGSAAGRDLDVTTRALLDVAKALSHDLRAPVNRINGFCRMVEDESGSALSAAAQHYLNRAVAATGTLDSMIAALVEWIRLPYGELDMEECDMSELASQLLQSRQAAEPSRRCDLRVAEGVRVTGDRRLLRLAMGHLLGNAWKFTADSAAAVIEFGESTGPEGRTLYVRDNGAGFTASAVNRLFMPFQRLHLVDEFPGLGMGLAMVRRVVECHGGRVWAVGAEGEGATFFFTIP